LKTLFFYSVIAFLSMIGCGKIDESPLTDQQEAARILDEGSTWGGTGKVEVVELPAGVDPAGLSNLGLSFDTTGEPKWDPTTFVANGADDFLATSNSSWNWADEERADVITLSEATSSELTNMTITEEEIQFTFQVTSPGGRTTGLDGLYTLKLLPR